MKLALSWQFSDQLTFPNLPARLRFLWRPQLLTLL